MLDAAPLLQPTRFPELRRARLEILQVNLGLLCNQSCKHCHVDAGPKRTEQMDRTTIDQVLEFRRRQGLEVLDLTGGAPELNPHFRYLVETARSEGVHLIDRCNLTVLEMPEQEGLAEFLAQHRVEVVASLPCYLEENVDGQRGKGVFTDSIRGLQRLNALGYGEPDSGLRLNLVYNPLGPTLPPPQCSLEQDYKKQLGERYGIRFNNLLTITNMPIRRFGSVLMSKGEFHDYLGLLKEAHQDGNLDGVMCRALVSVDWRGFLYDCDFNQMLGMAIHHGDAKPLHVADAAAIDMQEWRIRVGEHCYGCTAGQGSSCGGALND
ncbi:MAG TPA: radical SAM/Cys-rich domain protein [Chromatiales bacterium]|nr:radical SAM/Cys-rich domain protein [Chromatiales bacterium]